MFLPLLPRCVCRLREKSGTSCVPAARRPAPLQPDVRAQPAVPFPTEVGKIYMHYKYLMSSLTSRTSQFYMRFIF